LPALPTFIEDSSNYKLNNTVLQRKRKGADLARKRRSRTSAAEENAAAESKLEVMATVTVYQPYLLDLGEIALYGYVPFEENFSSEKIESSSILDSIKQGTRLLEKWKASMKSKLREGLIVVDLAGKGFTIHLGSYLEESSFPQLLFQRPARLNAVGKLARDGEKWHIEWLRRTISKEFYIYEGEVRFSGDPFDVILETDQGMRVVFVEDQTVADGNRAGKSG